MNDIAPDAMAEDKQRPRISEGLQTLLVGIAIGAVSMGIWWVLTLIF